MTGDEDRQGQAGEATVTMPDGRTYEVIVQRDLRCTTHGGQPGWGCEGCQESIVNAIVGFRPKDGWIDESVIGASSLSRVSLSPAQRAVVKRLLSEPDDRSLR